MELDKCIKNRRSIRSYLDKDVSFALVSKLIEAAHYAPSTGNIQNWRFIVVIDDKKRQKLAEACLKQFWMTEAPVHIVVCSDNRNIKKHYGKKAEKYIYENCAAAIQNLMLKAYDLGLGTCWVGSFNKAAVERIVEVKDFAEAVAVITVGYPAEKPISKRHNMEEVTFFERYGNLRRESRDFPSFYPIEKQTQRLEKKLEKSLSKLKKKLKKKKG